MFDSLQFINRNQNTSDDFDYGINERIVNSPNEWRSPWEVIFVPSNSKYQIISFDQENELMALLWGVQLLHSNSSGTVKLQDNDPSSPPIIDHITI